MQAEFLKMLNDKGLKVYFKIIEINLSATAQEYALDKWQSLNGKMIMRLIVPSINSNKYGNAFLGGTGTYVANPASVSNKPLAAVEAIDGAYITLTNTNNQQVLDRIPLMLYRQDFNFFTEKGVFADLPTMDWTQSLIRYPSLVIPAAQAGNSWQLVVCYLDVLNPEK